MGDYGYVVAQALVYALQEGEGIITLGEDRVRYVVFRIDDEETSAISVARAEDLDIDLLGAPLGSRVILHDSEEEAEAARADHRMKMN